MRSTKGINSAVSISLVLMLTALSMAIMGYEIFYLQHSTQHIIKNTVSTETKKTQSSLYTCIKIESIHESTIYLRNCGNSIINTSKLSVYVDGIPQKIDTNYSTKIIYPNKLGKIYIKNHFIGTHEVKLDYMHYAQDSITHNFGYAYLVEGNSHMTTSGDLNITPNESFTFMAWVYFGDIPALNEESLALWINSPNFCYAPGLLPNRMIMFLRYPSDEFNSFWTIHDNLGLYIVYFFWSNNVFYDGYRIFPFLYGWHFVVESWNASNNNLTYFFDGHLEGSETIKKHYTIRNIQLSSCGTVDIHTFDDIRIYKTALNQTQIIRCMYGDNCPTKGLIAYYNFNNCKLENSIDPSKFWITGKNIICVNSVK